MLLREDEIEALLKLDKAKLKVHGYTKTWDGGQYVAVIFKGDRHFCRESYSRLTAIQDVWEVYQAHMADPNRDTPQWLMEEAMSNVMYEYIKILQEKLNVGHQVSPKYVFSRSSLVGTVRRK